MHLRSLMHLLACFVLTTVAAVVAKASPPRLPANAVTDNTFFVATVDLAKAGPAALQATAKAALGDSVGQVEELLSSCKSAYEKYAGDWAESVTVTMGGDPGSPRGAESIFYIKIKPGKAWAAAEKVTHDGAAESDPAAMAITLDGDYLVLRKKGVIVRNQVASTERTKLFAEAFGDSDKPVVAALIFSDALTRAFRRHIEPQSPIGLSTIVNESKWLRLETTLGANAAAKVTIQTAEEQAAARVANGVKLIGTLFRQEAAKMKKGAEPDPGSGETAEGLLAVAEAFTPHQAGASVTLTADTKALGAILGPFFTSTVARQSPAAKKGP